MATSAIILSTSSWILVSPNGAGTLENMSTSPVLFRFAATQPNSAIDTGHILQSGVRYQWSYAVAQNLYARFPPNTVNTVSVGSVMLSD